MAEKAKVKKFGLESVKSFYKLIMAAVTAAISAAVAEVKAAFGAALEYKGSVATYDALPQEGQVKGDTYNVEAAFEISGKKYPEGTNVAWDGTKWDPLGGVVDLSNLATKTELSQGLEDKLDSSVYEEEKEDFLTEEKLEEALEEKGLSDDDLSKFVTVDDFEEYSENEIKQAVESVAQA